MSSTSLSALCFLFHLLWQQSIGYDFSFTISKEAFSDKLLSGYVPGMNFELSQTVWPSGSNSGEGEEIHIKWSNITLSYFSPLEVNKNLKAYLNPKRQTIEFSINNLVLHSDIFNITFSYRPPVEKRLFHINTPSIRCNGNAQILINNYNLSVAYILKTSKNINKSTNKIHINNSTNKIHIDDCQLEIKVAKDSVKISTPKHDMPLDYTFENEWCNELFNNDYVEGVIRTYLDFFFTRILPDRWQKHLEKQIKQFEKNRQFLDLTDYNVTTYEILCYEKNMISSDGDLVISGLFLKNGSVDYHSHSHHKNDTNTTEPHIEHRFNTIVAVTIPSVSFLVIVCCSIGCICTLKEVVRRCKKKEKKDVVKEYYDLHISNE